MTKGEGEREQWDEEQWLVFGERYALRGFTARELRSIAEIVSGRVQHIQAMRRRRMKFYAELSTKGTPPPPEHVHQTREALQNSSFPEAFQNECLAPIIRKLATLARGTRQRIPLPHLIEQLNISNALLSAELVGFTRERKEEILHHGKRELIGQAVSRADDALLKKVRNDICKKLGLSPEDKGEHWAYYAPDIARLSLYLTLRVGAALNMPSDPEIHKVLNNLEEE